MYKTLEDITIARQIISPPGDTLAETLSAKGINQPSLALRMGRPVKTINEIIKGKAAIMPETAIQLERSVSILCSVSRSKVSRRCLIAAAPISPLKYIP